MAGRFSSGIDWYHCSVFEYMASIGNRISLISVDDFRDSYGPYYSTQADDGGLDLIVLKEVYQINRRTNEITTKIVLAVCNF